MAFKEFNTDIEVQGKISLTKVPNKAGTLLTYGSDGDISSRTNAQIISDLGLISATNIASSYYTKIQLQTSGQAQVHWGNITSKPNTVEGYGITDAHKVDRTGGLTNASDSHRNQSWFDYNWADTGKLGSVISFGGLSEIYNTEFFGRYNGDGNEFGVRTRNGDTNVWNPTRWLWHSGNFNPTNYVPYTGATSNVNLNNKNLSTTGLISANKGFSKNIGNGYGIPNVRLFPTQFTAWGYLIGAIVIEWEEFQSIDSLVIRVSNPSWDQLPQEITVNLYSGVSYSKILYKNHTGNPDIVTSIKMGSTPTGKPCIVLNNIDYQWSYPQVIVEKYIGGSSTTASGDWDTYVITDLTGFNVDETYAFTKEINKDIADNTYEPKFTKNTAFNKNFGTTAGTVAEGNILDTLKIGGRNLIKNIKKGAHFVQDGHYEYSDTYVTSDIMDVVINSSYILSCNSNGLYLYILQFQDSTYLGSQQFDFQLTHKIIPIGNRIVFTFSKPGDIAVSVEEFKTYKVKFEKGNIATDWTPAPEDQISDWDTADVNDFSFIKNKPSLNFDNYGSWNLRTNGVQRTTMPSGSILDLVAGANTTLTYGAGGVVTINSTDTNTTYTLASLGGEPAFTKNTAFNKNFGTTTGTVAEGNDSRINNGQTAYSWGNHTSAGYLTASALSPYAQTSWVNANFDKYTSWNLKTNGEQRIAVTSGGTLDIKGGTNVSVSYGAGGAVTISATNTDTNTTYVAGDGISITGANNVITNTKPNVVQTLSGSGNTINLSNGGSYTIPAQSWGSITGKPTTIVGYGITDAIKINNSGGLNIHSGVGATYNAASNNSTWFDYNWADTGRVGSAISFGGFGAYNTEIFANYNGGEYIAVRTRNDDANKWNPVRELWHTGNFNPSNFLTQETDPTVPTHVKSISSGNIAEWNESFKRRTTFVSNVNANDKSFLSGYYSIETANGTENTNFPSNSAYGVFSRMSSNSFTTDIFYYNAGDMAFRTWYNPGVPSTWRVVWDNVNLTKLSQLSNDSGYITSSALSPYAQTSWVNANFIPKSHPVFNVTTANINDWNTAVSWGNHVGLYSLLNHSHTFNSITNKPTTIAGYGITDAYVKTQVDTNIKTAVDNIQIGGRNLLLKSNVDIINFNNDYHIGSYSINQPLIVGETYTLVVHSGNSGTQQINAYVDGYQLIGSLTMVDGGVTEITFIAQQTDAPRTTIAFYNGTRTSGVAIYWATLVKGNKGLRGHVPAPEDLVTDWNTTDVNDFSFFKNKPTNLSQFTNDAGYLLPSALSPYAQTSWVSANFDKYTAWNLQTNNVQRTSMPSGANLNLVAGTNVTISYSAGGTVTINAANSGVPTNMVTTDTTQTIEGSKTFNNIINFKNNIIGYFSNGSKSHQILIQDSIDRADLYITNKTGNGVIRLSALATTTVFQVISPTNGEIMSIGDGAGYAGFQIPNATARVRLGRFADYLTQYMFIVNGNSLFENTILCNSSITASSFYESSLREFKTNIKPYEKSGLELINDLEIVTFDRKDESVKNKIGIIADDSPKEFLSEELDAVDLYKTVFIQAKAIQELTEEVNNLRELLMSKLNQI